MFGELSLIKQFAIIQSAEFNLSYTELRKLSSSSKWELFEIIKEKQAYMEERNSKLKASSRRK